LDTLLAIVLYFIAYALGGIPFGVVVARRKAGVDIREIGSGGMGATNIYRALGLKWAVLVFAADAGKGAAAAALPGLFGLGPVESMGCAFIAVFSHVLNPYLRGRGGKGVATAFGAMLIVSPETALAAMMVWAAFTMLYKVISLASLMAAASLPIFAWILVPPPETTPYAIGALAISALAAWAHSSNIKRLTKGEEKPIAGYKP